MALRLAARAATVAAGRARVSCSSAESVTAVAAAAAKIEKKKRASELDSLNFFLSRHVLRATSNIFLTLT